MFCLTVLLLAFGFCQAQEDPFEQGLVHNEAEGRIFNTSSTAGAITLLGALILLGVIAYLIYVGGLLNSESSGYGYNRNDYYNQPQYDAYEQE